MPQRRTKNPPAIPRQLDPSQTLDSHVAWVKQTASEQNAPGIIVGLSGTDSILTFLICARAFELMGRGHHVLGIHYGPQPGQPPKGKSPMQQAVIDEDPAYAARFLTHARRGYDYWIPEILDWLKQQAPNARIKVESGIDYTDDYQRWANIFKNAVHGDGIQNGACAVGDTTQYWIAGTRNKSEQVLGTYSNISGTVSLQPIIDLWKSEVLDLCRHLGVPRIALEKSREADCGCGRMDIAADNIEEVDSILMVREGTLSRDYLTRTMQPELLKQLENFVDRQLRETNFKHKIPYLPPKP